MSAPEPNEKAQAERTERGMLRVLQYASSFSFGAMAGFLYSVKQVNPVVRIEFGLGAILSFLFMGGATWFFWHLLLDRHHLEGTSPTDRRFRVFALIALSVLLVAGMVIACLRAMQTLPQDRYLEMVEGMLLAFGVMAALGVVFWRLVRYLEQDHERGVERQRRDSDS